MIVITELLGRMTAAFVEPFRFVAEPVEPAKDSITVNGNTNLRGVPFDGAGCLHTIGHKVIVVPVVRIHVTAAVVEWREVPGFDDIVIGRRPVEPDTIQRNPGARLIE